MSEQTRETCEKCGFPVKHPWHHRTDPHYQHEARTAAVASQVQRPRSCSDAEHERTWVGQFPFCVRCDLPPAPSPRPASAGETETDATANTVENHLRWLVNMATEGAHAERDGDEDRAKHYREERVPLHQQRIREHFAAQGEALREASKRVLALWQLGYVGMDGSAKQKPDEGLKVRQAFDTLRAALSHPHQEPR